MKLSGMIRAFKAILESPNDLTSDEIVAHLTDAEWDDRYNRRLHKLIKNAKFRFQASLEQVDFQKDRNLNKNDIIRFSSCDWIQKGQNIIITGPTGAGKSFIACMLGNKACQEGYSILYFNCMKLFRNLSYAKIDGTYSREINRIQKQDLLILDDFGLEKLDQQSRMILLEILEDREGRKSTIFSTQLPPDNWHEIIGEPTVADAICDRLIHQAHKIDLHGESMRKKIRN